MPAQDPSMSRGFRLAHVNVLPVAGGTLLAAGVLAVLLMPESIEKRESSGSSGSATVATSNAVPPTSSGPQAPLAEATRSSPPPRLGGSAPSVMALDEPMMPLPAFVDPHPRQAGDIADPREARAKRPTSSPLPKHVQTDLAGALAPRNGQEGPMVMAIPQSAAVVPLPSIKDPAVAWPADAAIPMSDVQSRAAPSSLIDEIR
jgi:hypothetical protein